ncbi:spermine synthase-like [Pollicipes pollicipes]|uniref:spermine synthase-like n=1 Tax=Pollicipes pollicipes TaxID=41117 RepID=UPI0018858427|nr:spermine synthase-like [Pollicipes pollicipes]XP_037079957.1 spermine synthase-like [Pollicipes pollicipes]XP_037079958.1 spermine synthase-like [Pollicipes pollicipes]XP_037079960.1 spermine synthase-like [Pollicipes pollicipes]XP_037079961.1 spermine synthase-like [Pollicipes pollicipes]
MSFNTALLDFSVAPEVITNPVESATLHQRIEATVGAAVAGLTRLIEDLTPSGGFLLNYSADAETFVTLRGHPSGLVSLQIENYGEAFIMDNRAVLQLEKDIRAEIGARRGKAILPLRRGRDIDPFYYTSDDRLVEYGTLETLFDEVTPYQHVQVVRTRDFGNILVLDGFHNMSEKDLVYTETLMAAEQYEGKTALILGGGDGGLLYELLKHNPKFVTMVEIDDVVIQQCRKHLRTVCGDCLDKYDGDNYKIIVGDAFQFLRDCLKEGRTFDYIFYDLSDIPVSPKHDRNLWNMVRDVLHDSMALLPAGGKYMTHVMGINSPAALQEFETLVDALPVKTTRTQSAAFVPSFLETWVFYQITKC